MPSFRIAREAAWMHIDQLGGEVGVLGAAAGIQHDLERTDHLQLLLQWRRGVDQHVLARLDVSLIV